MSSFTYPWDLADLGVRDALTRMRDEGLSALELTACYHPITLFTPGAPGRRLVHLERGGVFFPARTSHYGRIKPELPQDPELLAVWPKAAEHAVELGLDLNAWTVAMYQPWIAAAYPETARVTPFGQRNHAGVCPTSPDVVEFLATLVGDLASQFPVRTVQLEGVTHPFVDTGWLLPRILVEWTPWGRWLCSLCFCASCEGEAAARGVDVPGLRSRVVAELTREYADGPIEERPWEVVHAERLADDEDYAGFLAMRDDACVQLVRAVSGALRSANPDAGLGIWGPAEFDGTRLPLERVLPELAVIQTRQPLVAPENAAAARAVADAHDLRVTAVLWCGGRIGPSWGPDFEAALQACVDLGIDQVQLFNWAMLRPAISQQIGPLLRRLQSAR